MQTLAGEACVSKAPFLSSASKGEHVSKYIRWQALLTLLGIVLVGAVLFYVSWGRQPGGSSTSSSSSGTTVVRTHGGTYVEGVAGYPQSINPLFSELNDLDRDLCALIFEGLTSVNERNEIVPLLARKWEVSDDGLVYTFYLRESVRWQGSPPA